jgi:ASC-1-like (ASCH) protein
MAKIEKKIWPKHFEEITSGKKKYEIRLADFDAKEGDVLVLREWDQNKKEYTGRMVEKVVTDVRVFRVSDLEKFWPKKDIEENGIQIISF